jgi:hypothetical protein
MLDKVSKETYHKKSAITLGYMKEEIKIIRAKHTREEYQYSAYEVGWVFEVIRDFGEYYTARVLSGSRDMHDSVIAVHKEDCEELHLGSYKTDGEIHMKL